MIVLGIDTSGYANAVGVVNGEKVLAGAYFEARTDSLEKIVANIDEVLRSAGLTLEDVQGIGVGLGPGSWTGIRVGVTVGKILAFSTAKPIAGVPTLEALAYNTRKEADSICSVISAGAGGAVYAATYRAPDDNLKREDEYYVGSIQGLLKTAGEKTLFVGAAEILNSLREEAGSNIRTMVTVPAGAAIARLAARRLEKNDQDDALALAPLYLKESTAKVFVNKYTVKEG